MQATSATSLRSHPPGPSCPPRWTMAAALLSGGLALAAITAPGASFSASPAAEVPDGDAAGLVNVLEVPSGLGRITRVTVSLTLSGDAFGGWNGDLYALIAHDGVFSVLVNRLGRTAANPFGYDDNGLQNLTFDDEAGSGDIHLYQSVPGISLAPGEPLSGTWQPDARRTDPGLVRDSDPRTNFLSVFDGQEAAGEWRLYVADLSRGAVFTLDHWALNLETDPNAPVLIPESSWGTWFGAGSLLLILGDAARRRTRPSPSLAVAP